MEMPMRRLGNSGVQVSALGFGTMTFGSQWKHIGTTGQPEADRIVGRCLDAGINFFDTADVYSSGESEEILGRALGPRRREVILATKVRSRMSDAPNDVGLSRHHILNSVDASLRRLGTDWIDLYQLHTWDALTPIEVTLRALDDCVRWGKVRYIGASNFAGWQLMKSLAVSERAGLERFVTLQPLYNLMIRDSENELVPLCLEHGLGIFLEPAGGRFPERQVPARQGAAGGSPAHPGHGAVPEVRYRTRSGCGRGSRRHRRSARRHRTASRRELAPRQARSFGRDSRRAHGGAARGSSGRGEVVARTGRGRPARRHDAAAPRLPVLVHRGRPDAALSRREILRSAITPGREPRG